MKKVVGIVLIVASILLGFNGINKVSNSGESVEVIGIELSASDEKAKTTGYIIIGLAVACFADGVSIVGRN